MTMTAPSHTFTPEYLPAGIPLESVVKLCDGLEQARIRYCHWKSNIKLDKSAIGDTDLDLLVERADARRFGAVLNACGFKLIYAPREKRMSGVQDYLGYDAGAQKWVHVHAHYQLVVGHDLSKNYRVAIERPYLESSVQQGIFKVPSPEYEFIVFVIRMVLKHSTWQSIINGEGRLKKAEWEELVFLQTRMDDAKVDNIIETHLPYIGPGLLRHCIRALGDDSSISCRFRAGQQIEAALRAHARRPMYSEFALRMTRRVVSALRRRVGMVRRKYSFATGGATIAMVGGDGAGKSTAIEGLDCWLSEYFRTKCAHLGKPRWSGLTTAVRGLLKLGQLLGLYGVEVSFRETLSQSSFVSPGYPWIIREVCRARDRYRTYLKAKRTAANGDLIIFDRFPLPQIETMDGPLVRRFARELADTPGALRFLSPRPDDRLVRLLTKLEEGYYRKIVSPEVLIVLRVDPDIATQRKPEDDEFDVRERSTEIWSANWERTNAYIVDANKCRSGVLADTKEFVWSQL